MDSTHHQQIKTQVISCDMKVADYIKTIQAIKANGQQIVAVIPQGPVYIFHVTAPILRQCSLVLQ